MLLLTGIFCGSQVPRVVFVWGQCWYWDQFIWNLWAKKHYWWSGYTTSRADALQKGKDSNRYGRNTHTLTQGVLASKFPISIWTGIQGQHGCQIFRKLVGELIYTWKIGFLAGLNLQVRIKPDIFSRFSQPEHFPRFKPDHLLLNRARFSGDNLCYYLTFLAGLNLQVQTWINM